MSQINRVPQGLQDLLGSKNFGDNPAELSQVVAPTTDLSKFYEAERRSWFQPITSINMTAEGAITSLAVPEGQLWFVQAIGTRWSVQGIAPATPMGFRVGCQLVDPQNANVPGEDPGIADLGAIQRFDTAPMASWMIAEKEFSKPVPCFSGEAFLFVLEDAPQLSAVSTIRFWPFIRYTKLFV